MKQFFTLGLAIMIAFAASAQKNVTKFLGIPVDGTKAVMIQKLKAKGYTYDAQHDCLEGEFNGRDVRIGIITNNNKVYRVFIMEKDPWDEGQVKLRFNNLCHQFEKNSNYLSPSIDPQVIADNENLSYEMNVNKKQYSAMYYQISDTDEDTTGFTDYAMARLNDMYTDSELAQLNANLNDEQWQTLANHIFNDFIIEKIKHKCVWFSIKSFSGKYFIALFYDNRLNEANGEDL